MQIPVRRTLYQQSTVISTGPTHNTLYIINKPVDIVVVKGAVVCLDVVDPVSGAPELSSLAAQRSV
jgi:delta-aminolevulinic acid dehydratase/porphobilinogen synthase